MSQNQLFQEWFGFTYIQPVSNHFQLVPHLGLGIVTYLENLKYLVNPQKCDDRVDHKQTKTTPSKHIFPIGQLQQRRLPCLPYLPYIPYIPYLTYLAYITRPPTDIPYITLHYITLHYTTLHYITSNQIKSNQIKLNSIQWNCITLHTLQRKAGRSLELWFEWFANPRQTHRKLRKLFHRTHSSQPLGREIPPSSWLLRVRSNLPPEVVTKFCWWLQWWRSIWAHVRTYV